MGAHCQLAAVPKLAAKWWAKRVGLQMTALQSTYHKVQKADSQMAMAADNTQEPSSCPISCMTRLQQWLTTQNQWVSLDQVQQNNADMSNAIASADRLSTVPPIQSGSEASTAAMRQLLQLMQDVHASDEQLAEAEKSLETRKTEGLEYLSKAMEILHAYADLMKCELESFVHHRSEKIRLFQEATKLLHELQAKKVAHAHIAGIFETVLGISGDAVWTANAFEKLTGA